MDETKLFLHLEEFKKKNSNFYSIIDMDVVIPAISVEYFLEDKVMKGNYTPIFLKSIHNTEKIYYVDGIFKHSGTDIYIYLSRMQGQMGFSIKFMYNVIEHEYVKLLINGFKKMINGNK